MHQCNSCEKIFASKFSLQRHNENFHSKNFLKKRNAGNTESVPAKKRRYPLFYKQENDDEEDDNDNEEDDEDVSSVDDEDDANTKQNVKKDWIRFSDDDDDNDDGQSQDADYKPDEKEQWYTYLEDVIKSMNVDAVEDIYRDPEQFEIFLEGIRTHLGLLKRRSEGILDGKIVRQVRSEYDRLRKHGYSSEEAEEVAWFNRRFLFKKLLNDSEEELDSLFSNGSPI